jgi:hypothetical protein
MSKVKKQNPKIPTGATCVKCGCTDQKGCPLNEEGWSCTWIEFDGRAKVGICSRCVTRESVDDFKAKVKEFLFNNPHLATSKEKKLYGIKYKYPVKKVYNKINELQNRREYLSAEKRREGRCE